MCARAAGLPPAAPDATITMVTDLGTLSPSYITFPEAEGNVMLRPSLTNGVPTPQVSRQPDTTPIAAIYARVSTTDQADKGYSLPTQLETCQAMAQQEGYTVPESHVFV